MYSNNKQEISQQIPQHFCSLLPTEALILSSQRKVNHQMSLSPYLHCYQGCSFVCQLYSCFFLFESVYEDSFMEVTELLEDNGAQSHAGSDQNGSQENSCTATRSSNKLFVLCTTTTVLCATTSSQLAYSAATVTRRGRTSIRQRLPRWSQHLARTADGVIHMGLFLAGRSSDNKKHLQSCRCWGGRASVALTALRGGLAYKEGWDWSQATKNMCN